MGDLDSLRVASGARGVTDKVDGVAGRTVEGGSSFVAALLSPHHHLFESEQSDLCLFSNLPQTFRDDVLEHNHVLQKEAVAFLGDLHVLELELTELFSQVGGSGHGRNLGLGQHVAGCFYAEGVVESYCRNTLMLARHSSQMPFFSVFGLDSHELPVSALCLYFGAEVISDDSVTELLSEIRAVFG